MLYWLQSRPDWPLPPDLMLQLSDSTRARLAGLRPERGLQLLLGRLLLLHAARQQLDPALQLADLTEHPDGYPWLPAYPECRGSISHTGELLAVVFNPAGRCGLDIEIGRPRQFARLAEKFCPEDARWLAAGGEATASERFYQLWTLREAAYKGGWREHVVGEPPARCGTGGPLPGWDSVLLTDEVRATVVWPTTCRIEPVRLDAAGL
ncbi:4'-phosphopantetheinyl transferase family protein [Chitinilyticum piscinae]|uniref:4'-phosphopantetheinyl transferase superfamily protein n=1 Tax=Chitinilyticum piscinae TaxID=2866724 RepID=A0A8J7FPT3_9NEIS|nr:4'-phosphopantetheinyl transferase superfamily protein [Chitinilyticum piscinae]MBE9609989.1 4'-phosphopantetheinyl transferase superfamily protein [Chitinilyticum piscinae]